jgi:putative ubiquitin-RnfH superfamily antitoxin RatB of RatAB toxin-antitoxin module
VSHKIAVEVVYALPEKQYLQRVTLEEATVEAAIRFRHPRASQRYRPGEEKVGIYSRPVKLGDVLKEGDRVEIYRPLIADPKELRRQRAEKASK